MQTRSAQFLLCFAISSLFLCAAFVGGKHTGAVNASSPPANSGDLPDAKLTMPKSGIAKVAFVVSADATLIDLAGTMQVFDQAQAPGTEGFQTFTVSESR